MKHKHMTKEMRERIEKGIREDMSLKEIAKNYLGEDVLKKLNISYVKPNDLIVKNIDLIKHELKKKSK